MHMHCETVMNCGALDVGFKMPFPSSFSGFKDKPIKERVDLISQFSNLSDEEVSLLSGPALTDDTASRMIENVFTRIEFPVGLATNFVINGKPYLIPMAVEEPSIVAACSYSAKLAGETGGFTADSTEPLMIGQIFISHLADFEAASSKILSAKTEILKLANSFSRTLSTLGAGARDLEIRKIEDIMCLHLIVDVRDAMGANIVNTMAEGIAPMVEQLTGGEVFMKILSNLSSLRISRASAVFAKEHFGGSNGVDRFLLACRMAELDPFRAATHNKGIMNGIDAVLLATMNDWRAAEAGAHSYPYLSGGYRSLTRFFKTHDGNVRGEIEIPMAVGTVGGAVNTVPRVKVLRKILNVADSREFASLLAAVGLAQNFAAVRALSMEGIQKGHMKLHSRNIAVSAGAEGEEVDRIAKIMVSEGKISVSRAREILQGLHRDDTSRREK